MNIIKLHKSITLNVFAILGLLLYSYSKWIEISYSFKDSSILIYIIFPLLLGLLLECLTKKLCHKYSIKLKINLTNILKNSHIKQLIKILYFTIPCFGIFFAFTTSNNIIRIIIMLSFTLLLIGVFVKYLTKKTYIKNCTNPQVIFQNPLKNKYVKWTLKIIYLIAFYSGISMILVVYSNIILGIILLSFIPINYLRKSYIANLFALLGLFWIGFNIHYFSGDLSGDKGDGVAWGIILFLLPASVIGTAIFVISMILERVIKKAPNYGQWLLSIPKSIHILYLHTGIIAIMFYTLYIYSFFFYESVMDCGYGLLR